MNNVPQKLRRQWALEVTFGAPRECLRVDEGDCQGRITKEHAMYFAGKQLQKEWAILNICAFHHAVDEFQDRGKLNKQKHLWLALNRATDAELKEISKNVDYLAMRERLNKIYV